MRKVMFQFQHPGPPPTKDQICQKFKFRAEEIDPKFGVVLIDPRDNSYAILVDGAAQDRVSKQTSGAPKEPGSGFFSNPPIDTFGPPKP